MEPESLAQLHDLINTAESRGVAIKVYPIARIKTYSIKDGQLADVEIETGIEYEEEPLDDIQLATAAQHLEIACGLLQAVATHLASCLAHFPNPPRDNAVQLVLGTLGRVFRVLVQLK